MIKNTRKLFFLTAYNFFFFWILLFKRNWGLNITLFELMHLLPIVWRTNNKSKYFYAKVILALGLSCFFWLRADFAIRSLSLLTVIGLNFVLFQESASGELISASHLFELPLIWLVKFVYYTVNLWNFLGSWQENFTKFKSNIRTQTVKKILTGIIFSVPIIFILIILFSSADQNFQNLFSEIFSKLSSIFNFEWLKNLNWIWAWIFQFGFFWIYLCLVFPYEDTRKKIQGINISRTIEKITVGILVSSIFAIFILTQFKTISFILEGFASGKLNPGQFIREGFFQLIIACLVGMTIFNVLKKELGKATLTLILLSEIFLVWATAGERVALYEYAFGLTQARVWGSFILIFVLTVIVSLALNLFKKINKKTKWQIYIISFACILFAAGLLNIDLFIASVRPPILEWKTDFNYMSAHLSYDAAPYWINNLNNPKVDNELKYNLIKNLDNYLGHLQDPYFRSTFNESFDITKFCDYKDEDILSKNFSISESKKQICENYKNWMKWESDYEFEKAKINKTHSPITLKVVSVDFSGYHAADNLNQILVSDMAQATKYKGQGDSALNYEIVGTKNAQGPIKTKNTQYNSTILDYNSIIKDFDICKINGGDIDEVWVWTDSKVTSQGFSISGRNITLNDSEAFEDPSHSFTPCPGKTMTIMVFNHDIPTERFYSLLYMILKIDTISEKLDKLSEINSIKDGPSAGLPGRIINNKLVFACGSIFFPVNDLAHGAAIFNSQTKVLSDCDDWKYNRTGNYKEINCTAWGCTDERYAIWWMQHIPGINNNLLDKNGKPMTNLWYAFGKFDDYMKILPSI